MLARASPWPAVAAVCTWQKINCHPAPRCDVWAVKVELPAQCHQIKISVLSAILYHTLNQG